MILNNTINARTFIYCAAYWSPHETTEYFSGGNGFYHQYAYVVHGQGLVEYRHEKSGDIIYTGDADISGTLVDISEYENTYQKIITTDQPLALFHINPLPTTRKLAVKLLKQGDYELQVTTHDMTVVCITGGLVANGKQIDSMQHARVRQGGVLTLSLPEHSVCVVVTADD